MSDENEQMKQEEVVADAATCAKCDEYLTGWKRALADYDNLKKDLGRQRGEMRATATAAAAMQFIPVLDNFDAALKFIPEGIEAKLQNWLNGVLYIRTQLENTLKDMGVESYGSVGDMFDANLHDAAGDREDESAAPNSIVEVVARGWKLSDRVVRPARVIVAA